jgi:hypothetical protein
MVGPFFGKAGQFEVCQPSMNRGPDWKRISSEVFGKEGPMRFDDGLEGVDEVNFFGSWLQKLRKGSRDDGGRPGQLRPVKGRLDDLNREETFPRRSFRLVREIVLTGYWLERSDFYHDRFVADPVSGTSAIDSASVGLTAGGNFIGID